MSYSNNNDEQRHEWVSSLKVGDRVCVEEHLDAGELKGPYTISRINKNDLFLSGIQQRYSAYAGNSTTNRLHPYDPVSFEEFKIKFQSQREAIYMQNQISIFLQFRENCPLSVDQLQRIRDIIEETHKVTNIDMRCA